MAWHTELWVLLCLLLITLITDPQCQLVKICFSKVKSMGTLQVSGWWSRTIFFPSLFYWSQESYIRKWRGGNAKWGSGRSLSLLIYELLIWGHLGSLSFMGSLFPFYFLFFPCIRLPQAASCYSAQLAWFQSVLLYIIIDF